MKIGFAGLGKMGFNMVKRLLLKGHEIVAYNRTYSKTEEVIELGAEGVKELTDIPQKLNLEKKAIWLMLPSGSIIDEAIDKLIPFLNRGDIIIDGGNSCWKDTIRRSEKLSLLNIGFVDCGTSGGIWGLTEGYCLMTGGKKEDFDFLEPVFKALAPEKGFVYCGESGSGHFVKMVHNGIEYGMMQAYAEGIELLDKSGFNLNLSEIAEVWKHGSVIRSWLLDLMKNAIDDGLDNIEPFVQDSGEGRWTVIAGIEKGVPLPVISASLFARFQSQEKNPLSMRVLSALRNQFGGHNMKVKEDKNE